LLGCVAPLIDGISKYKYLVKTIEPQRHNAAIAAHKEDGNGINITPL